jgi:hypothetical protein
MQNMMTTAMSIFAAFRRPFSWFSAALELQLLL